MRYYDRPVLNSAQNVSSGIKITWNAVDGATVYAIYRKEEGGSWSRIAKKAGTSYVNKNAVPGTSYVYTVRCMTADGTKYASSCDKEGLSVVRYYDRPVLNSAKNVSSGIKITWNAVDGASVYAVYRKEEGGSWSRIAKKAGTSYVNKNAVPGTSYVYTVRCMTADGTKYASSYDTEGLSIVRYFDAPVLDAVENVSGGITITWNAVDGASLYAVYRKEEGGSWSRIAKESGTSWTDTDVVEGTTYIYTVRCMTDDGSKYASSYDKDGLSITFYSTVYRALLVGEVNFDPVCERNGGDVDLMSAMLAGVTGPTGSKYSVTERTDLSRAQLISAISSTFGAATENDVSLFFIATHGDSVSSGEYAGALILADSSGSITSIKLDELADCLSAVQGKVIVILESCGSGAAIYENSASSDSMTFYANSASADSEAQQTADEAFAEAVVRAFAARDTVSVASNGLLSNTGEFRVESKFYVLTCSAYQQESWGTEDGPWNYFTKWLTNGIGTSGSMPADAAYGNSDGTLTLEEAYHYVSTVGDSYEFVYDGESYTQQVKRYPEGSSYELFTR